MAAFDIGDARRLQATFKNASAIVTDPSTVTFRMKDGGGTVTTLVFGTDAEVVKESTGVYHVDYTIIVSGKHFYRWEGTGALVSASEASFSVNASEF